jgi:hypothetical protein
MISLLVNPRVGVRLRDAIKGIDDARPARERGDA